MVSADLYRHSVNDRMLRKHRAISQGWADGLVGLARAHSVNVEQCRTARNTGTKSKGAEKRVTWRSPRLRWWSPEAPDLRLGPSGVPPCAASASSRGSRPVHAGRSRACAPCGSSLAWSLTPPVP